MVLADGLRIRRRILGSDDSLDHSRTLFIKQKPRQNARGRGGLLVNATSRTRDFLVGVPVIDSRKASREIPGLLLDGLLTGAASVDPRLGLQTYRSDGFVAVVAQAVAALVDLTERRDDTVKLFGEPLQVAAGRAIEHLDLNGIVHGNGSLATAIFRHCTAQALDLNFPFLAQLLEQVFDLDDTLCQRTPPGSSF